MSRQLQWTQFYSEYADKILKYKDNRKELISILQTVSQEADVKTNLEYHGEYLSDICPFTVFGMINRGISDKNRIAILTSVKEHFDISSEVPQDFSGIPLLNNLNTWFFKDMNNTSDIDELWNMFEIALRYDRDPNDINTNAFIEQYDKVIHQQGVSWNLTMGLFWIRPYTFINLDNKNRHFFNTDVTITQLLKVNNIDLRIRPKGREYLKLCRCLKDNFLNHNLEFSSFPEVSIKAWNDSNKQTNSSFITWFSPIIHALKELGGSAKPKEVRNQIAKDLKLSQEELSETRGKTKVNKFSNEVAFARMYLVKEGLLDKNSERNLWQLTDDGYHCTMTDEYASQICLKWRTSVNNNQEDTEDDSVHYWTLSAGTEDLKEEFEKNNMIAIDWPELEDLTQYTDRSEMISAMKEKYGEDKKYRNDSLATWQFAFAMKPGDIVYLKEGVQSVKARGVITSDYNYDSSKDHYRNIRSVKWTNIKDVESNDRLAGKTLTNISAFTEMVNNLESLFDIDEPVTPDIINDPYKKQDFLSEVFMSEDEYDTLFRLLSVKKNVILQGPPGVGKTFAAKRLAYSMMGEKDTNRVMMIQFHQSYSYEDFIIGYRPTETGFKLNHGPFYDFCKKADDDQENEYFFIIDEINRGNLSKIFGELLMLIEKDKRGDSLRILYSNELFKVPSNVYIIGMMNTADRSLSMIDYALRRRFAFFTLSPAFDSTQFEDKQAEADNEKLNNLIDVVKKLNTTITNDESLGVGFTIGHSYFCFDGKVTDEDVEAIVEYELIPLLKEYWFDEPTMITEWSEKLRGVLK